MLNKLIVAATPPPSLCPFLQQCVHAIQCHYACKNKIDAKAATPPKINLYARKVASLRGRQTNARGGYAATLLSLWSLPQYCVQSPSNSSFGRIIISQPLQICNYATARLSFQCKKRLCWQIFIEVRKKRVATAISQPKIKITANKKMVICKM